ncbi:MAG: DUF1361 domain-containing protein [Bacteroidota bacterium]
MKSIFRNKKQWHLFSLLAISSIFSVALLAFRLRQLGFEFSEVHDLNSLKRYRGEKTFLFLIWNLFLAWIPYGISILLPWLHGKWRSKLLVALVLFCWLLFFPNAPYILTDLLHLRQRLGIPLWYDLMLFLSFAWTGLILGYLSLLEVQVFLERFVSSTFSNVISVVAIFLCGFGIYLGRVQRWNSWDIITEPFSLFTDILHLLANPQTLGLAAVISVFLLLGYFTLTTLTRHEPQDSF